MKIHQLSLFLENKPDEMIGPCRLLARANVNVRTLSLADTEQFGILRLIVSDWKRGAEILQEAGYVVNVTEMVAVAVPDCPGGMVSVLETLEGSEVNIEYMYAFPFAHQDRAVLLFRFDKPDQAIARLQSGGIDVLQGIEIYERIEA